MAKKKTSSTINQSGNRPRAHRCRVPLSLLLIIPRRPRTMSAAELPSRTELLLCFFFRCQVALRHFCASDHSPSPTCLILSHLAPAIDRRRREELKPKRSNKQTNKQTNRQTNKRTGLLVSTSSLCVCVCVCVSVCLPSTPP